MRAFSISNPVATYSSEVANFLRAIRSVSLHRTANAASNRSLRDMLRVIHTKSADFTRPVVRFTHELRHA